VRSVLNSGREYVEYSICDNPAARCLFYKAKDLSAAHCISPSIVLLQ